MHLRRVDLARLALAQAHAGRDEDLHKVLEFGLEFGLGLRFGFGFGFGVKRTPSLTVTLT